MSEVDWMNKLGWNEEHIEDLKMAGYAYIRQGKYEIALPLFRALVIVDPEDAYNHQTLSALYLQMGEPEKAMRYFDSALKLEGDHSPTMINLCKALFMLNKVDEGVRLANILKDDPNPAISNQAKALLMAYSLQ